MSTTEWHGDYGGDDPIIVRALAEESKTRKVLIYKGRRYLGWPDDP